MYRWSTVLLVFACFAVSLGLQCTSPHSSNLKFSLTSRRNETGNWIAQVQLGHEAGQKDAGPWEVDVDHTTAKCEDSESVLIVATVTAPNFSQKAASDSQKKLLSLGYALLPGFGYYKVYNERKSWQEGQEICTRDGTHLLVLNSEAEAKVLPFLWKPISSSWSYVFIGFHNLYKKGDYVTIFNNTLASSGYAKWKSGEPNGEQCGAVTQAFELVDLACDNVRPFFCEQEI